jgi:hypothetical protein
MPGINAIAGFFAGLFLSVFGRKRRVAAGDSMRMEFSTSTQRLGVRFTDRIRDVFRFRWIRKT